MEGNTNIERLQTFSSLFGEDGDTKEKHVIDYTMLSTSERQMFIEKLIKHIQHDNLRLLQKLRERIDRVGVKLPIVEIRYNNLHVGAEYEVVNGKPIPSIWNSLKSVMSINKDLVAQELPGAALVVSTGRRNNGAGVKLFGLNSEEANVTIIDGVSGIIKPGRLSLLLGPPGCGKSSLLKALSGNLDKHIKVTAEVSYNGYKLEEFIPQKTSAYISQNDLHITQMTVRETLNFSSRCQGARSRAEIMAEVCRREKLQGIIPDPNIDGFMKATSAEGQKNTLQTDYILKILGLDICADTICGDDMRRGISGGQKKRLTTGEMLAGSTQVLLMDEISNGLDSSTTYQIVASLQQSAHIMDATIVVALLQPAPETFDLFDDIILMSEGKIVYHGPRNEILEFFENCGFRCPERKGVADFLQEVLSRKDQAQYWHLSEKSHIYVTVDEFSRKFTESNIGKNLDAELSQPFEKSQSHTNAISFSKYSLSKWDLLKVCMSREVLIMKSFSYVYVFKSFQLALMAFITMTLFFRTRMGVDIAHANYYMGSLFYALIQLFFDAMPEMSFSVMSLNVFYRQRDLYFYPAWCYAIPVAILRIPVSFLQSLIWTSLTYYTIGYTPEMGRLASYFYGWTIVYAYLLMRFFRHFLLLFALNSTGMSLFRFIGSVCRTMVVTSAVGSTAAITIYLCGGFIVPKFSMPVWLRWAFWISPMTYGEIAIAENEFNAPRWEKMLPTDTTIGQEILTGRGLKFDNYFFWISVGALFGLTILFNVGYTLALTFLNSPSSRAIISREKLIQIQDKNNPTFHIVPSRTNEPDKGRTILPFEPLSVVFHDVQYYIDTPQGMKEMDFTENRLQLLCGISGALKPGVLTALMGVSGSGKTTLLDVLSGRKTTGEIEGEIRIGGYVKVQQTFSRVSGYCEQTDIHSPELTIEESLIFSAWLRLNHQIDQKTKYAFVREVLELIELDEIKDTVVGISGVNGLSTEQRKRLTIAVELVANPSIIFMDEPTTGLDARAAAIVMRVVKNIANTGRTIVCTIHQPSIDIFESFDELFLLKAGGRMIYSGPLGQHSKTVIDYFESITGVPKITGYCNPATWMMEVTSTSAEVQLGIDFAHIYKNSNVYGRNKELVLSLSSPPCNSKPLTFPTRFSQDPWGQFTSCLWKVNLSYMRSPAYNLTRCLYTLVASLFLGILFFGHGKKIYDQEDLFMMFGSVFIAVIFLGINNCSSVVPYVSMERNVIYRERFAGMYASWTYTFARVIIEVPYLIFQAIVFVMVTYPMIGYYWSVYKVFWYFYAMLCTLLYYTYLGMLLVSITPNLSLAQILVISCYPMLSLFSGYIIPKPHIPGWWIWLYYLVPSSWTFNALLTSQYGDMEKEILVFGQKKPVAEFIREYFGYEYDQLPFLAIVLATYPIIYAFLFSFFIGKLNFQRR